MAESDSKQQLETSKSKEQQSLKYLEFVQIAALQVLTVFSSLYNYAKENSGPLKPGVQTVEDNVKTVITPVYEKFHDVPLELLKFVDRKVESSVSEISRHVPELVKSASFKAYSAAQKAPELAREVKRVGLVDTATDLAQTVYIKSEPTAKELYAKYEPVAEHYAVVGWKKLNQLPIFPQLAHLVVPAAAYWADKYNHTVCATAKSGYTVSMYLPLVPIDEIGKVFGGHKVEDDETLTDVPVSESAVDGNVTDVPVSGSAPVEEGST